MWQAHEQSSLIATGLRKVKTKPEPNGRFISSSKTAWPEGLFASGSYLICPRSTQDVLKIRIEDGITR